jgi:hypothetical protein
MKVGLGMHHVSFVMRDDGIDRITFDQEDITVEELRDRILEAFPPEEGWSDVEEEGISDEEQRVIRAMALQAAATRISGMKFSSGYKSHETTVKMAKKFVEYIETGDVK